MEQTINKCKLVVDTCEWVVANSEHVMIDETELLKIDNIEYQPFDQFEHHKINELSEEEYLNFLFVLDSLNFCFWPNPNLEYDYLASSIKEAALRKILVPERLAKITETELLQEIFKRPDIPLADERARILRQLGSVIINNFQGSFSNIIKQASQSAVKLLWILTSNFPNFQDHAIYKGHQIHFYKRAQILIGDMWAHFQGAGPGSFADIDQITMFADYRVPQTLHQWGVLKYSKELDELIQSKTEIPHGGKYEVEIRAATVITVQRLRNHLKKNHGKEYKSIEIDWFLWEYGEKRLSQLKPHHRVLSIYY